MDGTSRTILGAFLTAFFMPYLWLVFAQIIQALPSWEYAPFITLLHRFHVLASLPEERENA